MRVINKRAQFFLLAAVVLSAVILSFGSVVNEARTNREADNFRDFTYEVKKEAGAVLDYEVYSGFDDGANITQFVSLMAAEMKERDPEANFIFIYGDHFSQTFWNEGTEDIYAGPAKTVVNGGDRLGVSKDTYAHMTFTSEIPNRDYDKGYGIYTSYSNLCIEEGGYIPESCINKTALEDCCETSCKDESDKDSCLNACLNGESFSHSGNCKVDGANSGSSNCDVVDFDCDDIYVEGCNDNIQPSGQCTGQTIEKDSIVDVGLDVSGHEMSFPFSKYPQVVFLVQKKVGNENYVATS